MGRGLLAAILALSAIAGAAAPIAPGFPKDRHTRKAAPDPSETSRFLPASIEMRSETQMRLFRALVSRLPKDSTRHWELRDGRLRVSYDMLQDLAGGNLPMTGGGLGERLARHLSLTQGSDFRSTGRAWGAYLPGDKWLMESPQWALNNLGGAFGERPGKAGVDINIARVWDKFSGSDSLIVAVLDAGYDFNHPELKDRNWVNKSEATGLPGIDDDNNGYVDDSLGWDFVENDNHPQDRHGHGTYVSSVIAARFDNREGIAGILAQGRIMPIRVLDASGHGDQGQIAKGILYALRNGAKVINFSIGGEGDNLAMRSAFQSARDNGVPIVVAAGNDAQNIDTQPSYPSSYTFENMLVVAAHDHAGLLCGFSNYGKAAAHLAAPGELILVCGLPEAKEEWKEEFEDAVLAWTVSAAGAFALSATGPVGGRQSLTWVAGNNVSATSADSIDLIGVKGAVLEFRLDFTPANTSDAVIVEGNRDGSTVWTEIAVVGSASPPGTVHAYGLQDLDGSRFTIRFRTSLGSRFGSAGRALKIDDVKVNVPDTVPPAEPIYSVIAGTSLAAPHVTAYVGLQRLACDRMGIPWNRALALAGVVPESSLAGRVSTGGRLDAYKGLEFYLATLPDFHVLDSNARTWKGGQKVEYSLVVSPAPARAYAFSGSGLPPGAFIDGAGKLTWTPGPQQAGDYSVRLAAEGPTIMRKLISFTVQASEPVALDRPSGADRRVVLLLAGRAFLPRPEMLKGSHLVEVFGTDAAGKVQLLKRDRMEGSSLSGAPAWTRSLAIPRGAFFSRLQISVDGIFLSPGQ
jgi:hypothetical protein